MATPMMEDIADLIAELCHIQELLNNHETDEAIEELVCQSGTIQTIIEKAGGSK